MKTLSDISLAAVALVGATGLASIPIILDAMKAFADRVFQNRDLVRRYNDAALDAVLAKANGDSGKAHNYSELADDLYSESEAIECALAKWYGRLSLRRLFLGIPGLCVLSAILFAVAAGLFGGEGGALLLYVLFAVGGFLTLVASWFFWDVIRALHELRFLDTEKELKLIQRFTNHRMDSGQ